MPNERTEQQPDAPDGTDAPDVNVHEGQIIRKGIDEYAPDRSMNPKIGEDPGLLPLTEDPRERRLKRNTM